MEKLEENNHLAQCELEGTLAQMAGSGGHQRHQRIRLEVLNDCSLKCPFAYVSTINQVPVIASLNLFPCLFKVSAAFRLAPFLGLDDGG